MCNGNDIPKPDRNDPHVVILGAGASRAAFPNGDASGNILPIMNDIVKTIKGLKEIVEQQNLDININFENIYNNMDKKSQTKTENLIFEYFSKMRIPGNATIYDKLLLSLRKKDVIFSFNWDPLLLEAYNRNKPLISMPNIYFLHGNVRIGFCKKCQDVFDQIPDSVCKMCGKKRDKIPLLYPIIKKNYSSSNAYIHYCWEELEKFVSQAGLLTIFGYSAPEKDVDARDRLRNSWFKFSERKLIDYVEIIDIEEINECVEKWSDFSKVLHIKTEKCFEDSFLYRWPRRTCEVIISHNGIPINSFPLANTSDLSEVQKSALEIAENEF